MEGIREFTPRDTSNVISLWRNTGIYVDKLDKEENLRKKHEFDPELFIVHEENSRIIGTAMGFYDGWMAFIAHVAVDEGHRREGIGAALMDEMEKRLRKKGARTIQLDSYAGDKIAEGFYSGIGYKKRAKLDNWMKDL